MSEQELVTVTIDGRTARVPKGTLVVEAAKQVGIDIPVFCYHPKLDPVGVCRMCLVEIEKIPKPQPACTTRVSDGMVVHTQTQRVSDLRRGVLEFLLLNHPLDCPVCDKGGECDLQDLTFAYGQTTSRLLDPKIRKDKAVELGNFIILDNERCILCRRCVRFDNEIAGGGHPDHRGARPPEHHHDDGRPGVQLVLQRQHHRAVPGGRADLGAVPVPGASVGPFQGRCDLHPLPGGLQRAPGVPARRAAAGHLP
ncbi:MAG: hypothetical protein A6D92_01090 [Symbiobacterium thermophilum]|uniref:2Fe-2S iron-sulfur cluster binding domain-containing protein n=1 Tax=Symbiobacterium thermophilum TaxID=2734 RepID=A0A1Y2T8X9_SYMTR|nr:MAG: hypothetical protein A6D92_01090 [Symbiobacterium thermophilum]